MARSATCAIRRSTDAKATAPAAVERRIAQVADRAIQRVSGAAGHGAVVSHLTSVAAITAGLVGAVAWITHRVEAEISVPDGVLGEPPTSPVVSGCQGSAVCWAPLTRDARRHLASATPAQRIASVMDEPAIEPIRLYVGLTSAGTAAERASLALAELERTGALDRGLLVLCSPHRERFCQLRRRVGLGVPHPGGLRLAHPAVLVAAIGAVPRPGGRGTRAEPGPDGGAGSGARRAGSGAPPAGRPVR